MSDNIKDGRLSSDVYFDAASVITKNRTLNFVVGERGTGKTYGFVKAAIRRYKKKGRQFIYVRRRESELITVHSLLKPFMFDDEFQDYEFRVDGNKSIGKFLMRYNPSREKEYRNKKELDEALIKEEELSKEEREKLYKEEIEQEKQKRKGDNDNFKDKLGLSDKDIEEGWECIGYYMALSTAYKHKGATFPLADWYIYDEFLYERHDVSKELPDEVNALANSFETIFRMRNFQAFLLGNATTFETCYKYYFDLQLPFHSNVWYHKTRSILVMMIDNPKYRDAKKLSAIGRLMAGTAYEAYAINNEFAYDNKSYVKKKSGDFRYVLGFYYKGQNYGVFTNGSIIVIDFTKRTVAYAIQDEDLDKDNILTIKKNSPIVKYLSRYFTRNVLYYQNMSVKTKLHKLFQKIL